MYEVAFHPRPLDEFRFLVTGGAGFIGSHVCQYLLHHGAGQVRVLDNLSEGRRANVEPWLERRNFEFIHGDITDLETCQRACQGIDYVSHQAALGSVPRSIQTPLVTNAANVTGFLNLLTAAKDAGVQRFIYASSSSVYGDRPELPKQESRIGRPLSPYAASKLTNEVYAAAFAHAYGIDTIGLRYFNVFGPRQKPDGPYAAVIPLFIESLLQNRAPFINGDGEQSRDFTFVANAVEANIRAMFTTVPGACNQVYNVAFGQRRTINQLYQTLCELTGSAVKAIHRDERPGDVRDSLADISRAAEFLGYAPRYGIDAGLEQTLAWFQQRQ